MKQVLTFSSPKFVYPDPDKQYYLFTDSSKHSQRVILMQYHEHVKEDGTIVNVPHPMTYQNNTLQGSQKNWGCIDKRSLCDLYIFSQNDIPFKGC